MTEQKEDECWARYREELRHVKFVNITKFRGEAYVPNYTGEPPMNYPVKEKTNV